MEEHATVVWLILFLGNYFMKQLFKHETLCRSKFLSLMLQLSLWLM